MILDSFRLNGKVALVTGSSRGQAAAVALAEAGADVALLNRTPARETAQQVKALGRQVHHIEQDLLATPQELDNPIQSVVDALGRIDILVNNAGIIRRAPPLEHPASDWDNVLAVNVGAVFTCRRLQPRDSWRRAEARSSTSRRCCPSIAASWCRVTGRASTRQRDSRRTFANELAASGVNVNAIAPWVPGHRQHPAEPRGRGARDVDPGPDPGRPVGALRRICRARSSTWPACIGPTQRRDHPGRRRPAGPLTVPAQTHRDPSPREKWRPTTWNSATPFPPTSSRTSVPMSCGRGSWSRISSFPARSPPSTHTTTGSCSAAPSPGPAACAADLRRASRRVLPGQPRGRHHQHRRHRHGHRGRGTYTLPHRACLYIGRGTQDVVFADAPMGEDAGGAVFYLFSAPAHTGYPTKLVRGGQGTVRELGDQLTSNRRTLNQYIHENGIRSCQILMGVTELHPGSMWNTMPAHTHDRRSECYLYFDVPDDARVIHLMGLPTETRHLLIADRQVVISPSWSVHCGVGTAAYSFIWAMAGENQSFDDMDPAPVTALS